MNCFSSGIDVDYKGLMGKIRFVGEDYITVCTSVGEHRSGDLCVLVYKQNWNEIKLLKESSK
jgi:hypothetical protein